jgi:hypothetical protein
MLPLSVIGRDWLKDYYVIHTVNLIDECSGINLVQLAHSRITKGGQGFTKMSHFAGCGDWLCGRVGEN